jgi:hypothetical protein
LYETFFSFFTEVNEDANDDKVSKLGASRLVVVLVFCWQSKFSSDMVVRPVVIASINFNMNFHVARVT